MGFEKITSKQNERIRAVVKLQDRRSRQRFHKFIIEGVREVERAVEGNIQLTEFYYCPELFSIPAHQTLLKKVYHLSIPIIELTREVFEKVSLREGPDGVLALGIPLIFTFSQLLLRPSPLLLVVESIEKPGNLGALIRTAEAVGADALFVADPVVDIFNPQVIRTSQGQVFKLPVIVSDNTGILKFLTEHSMQILATTPHVQKPYWSVQLTQPTALLIGSEKEGLSSFWLSQTSCIQRITIPMLGSGDSLNVNAAAAIILYEALRQRMQ
jgi:RNA methyltransferase, TrmH family